MKSFKRSLALLLMLAIALLPVAGLGEAAIDAMKTLIEVPQVESLPAAVGTSIYSEVDSDTDKGCLCMLTMKEDSYSAIISGINSDNKYEVRMYMDLNLVQVLYYAYIISGNYSSIQAKLPSGAQFSMVFMYGEDGVLFITDADKAQEFNQMIITTISELANK